MYGVILWAGNQNSIDVLGVAEQCLHCIKVFSVSHSIQQAGNAQEDGRGH